jgi:hypothetical protein
VIRNVERFEYDMVNDIDMEGAIRAHQGMLDITRDDGGAPESPRGMAGGRPDA